MTAEGSVDFRKISGHLQDFDFRSVFVEDLGWSTPTRPLRETTVDASGVELRRRPIAALSGFIVLEIEAADGSIPDAKVRTTAHKPIGTLHHEHVLVFVDRARQKSVWSWVYRKEGRDHLRTRYYFRGQPGDLFIASLGALMFDLEGFDEEGNVAVVEVANRVRAGLNVETVTKKFYAGLQHQHRAFLDCVHGDVDEHQKRRYVSALLNRVMFIYFLQRNGFLDGSNRTYLEDKLVWSRRTLGEDRYFTEIIEPLFFEGFALPGDRRSKKARGRLGRIHDLSLFVRADFVDQAIGIPDAAFESLLAFFAQYDFCLEDTPSHGDAINPSVLGYIFETHLDQKSSGASFMRPEIADWLCEEAIHHRVLDRVNNLEGAAGRARFEEMSDLLLKLTPTLCRSLLGTVLPGLSILDPACRSGAFLVAALRVMFGIYGAVAGAAKTLPDQALRDEVRGWEEAHPSLGYYLKMRVITDNLFGIEPMEEAVEVARLRLFLSLIASTAPEQDLYMLPKVDLHVKVGNALDDVLVARRGFDVVVTNATSPPGGKRLTTAQMCKLFVDGCYRLLRDEGQLGLVLPAGIYKDEGTRGSREVLFEQCTLQSLVGLRAGSSGWPGPRAICLIVGRRGGRTEHFFVAFGDVSKRAAAEVAALLRDHEARFCITSDFVRRASPRSLAVMEIGSALDLVPFERLLQFPRLGDAWTVEMGLGVQLKPKYGGMQTGPHAPIGTVYAANAIKSYAWLPDRPRLTLTKNSVVRQLGFWAKLTPNTYALAFRNAAPSLDGHILNAALIPPGVIVDASVTGLWLRPDARDPHARGQPLAAAFLLYLLALFNGYPLDWMIRMRGSRHILVGHVLDLPVPRPAPSDALFRSIVERAARLTCTTPAFDDLAKAVGLKSYRDGATAPEARARLRAEIDGIVAHLYGLTEDDFAYILKAFPAVPEPVKVAAHNAYRAVAHGDLL